MGDYLNSTLKEKVKFCSNVFRALLVSLRKSQLNFLLVQILLDVRNLESTNCTVMLNDG